MGSIGEQRDYSHVPRWKQILSLVVLIATILGMIFEKQTGISLTVAGCIGAGAGHHRRVDGKTGL